MPGRVTVVVALFPVPLCKGVDPTAPGIPIQRVVTLQLRGAVAGEAVDVVRPVKALYLLELPSLELPVRPVYPTRQGIRDILRARDILRQ